MRQAKPLLLSVIAIFCTYFLIEGIGYQSTALAADKQEACETEVPESDEDIIVYKGARVKIIDGDTYLCQKGKWVFSSSMVNSFAKRYKIKKEGDNCEITIKKTGVKYNLPSQFSSGFEENKLQDLFRPNGWTITTLLSPKANSIKKYLKLHEKLMQGGKFLDNRMDLDTKIVHSGKKALRFYSVKPGIGMKTTKSLVEKKWLCFAKGDHIWFSAWYYIKKGMPSTLFDFETRRFSGGPGIRLFVRRQKYASMELKFADKPVYDQLKVPLPRQKWFNLKLHLVLSNHEDGVIELWQDGVKILSTRGRTLPTHDTIYDSMQVGITATPRETVMLIDDVKVSTEPF